MASGRRRVFQLHFESRWENSGEQTPWKAARWEGRKAREQGHSSGCQARAGNTRLKSWHAGGGKGGVADDTGQSSVLRVSFKQNRWTKRRVQTARGECSVAVTGVQVTQGSRAQAFYGV